MQQAAKAVSLALGLAVSVGGLLWQALPADATALATFVPLLLALGVVAAGVTVYGDAIEERREVTGGGPRDGHSP